MSNFSEVMAVVKLKPNLLNLASFPCPPPIADTLRMMPCGLGDTGTQRVSFLSVLRPSVPWCGFLSRLAAAECRSKIHALNVPHSVSRTAQRAEKFSGHDLRFYTSRQSTRNEHEGVGGRICWLICYCCFWAKWILHSVGVSGEETISLSLQYVDCCDHSFCPQMFPFYHHSSLLIGFAFLLLRCC